MKRYFSKLAGALVLSSLCAMNTQALTVADGETHVLEPDNYYLEELILGANSTLVVKGETRIFTQTLQSKNEAKIVYEKGAASAVQDKWLRFEAMDASQMEGMLMIDGTGADGVMGATGATGANGRDATWDFPSVKGAKPGSPGSKGGTGVKGENGMNIEVNLLNLPATAFVTITSNGGNGGIGGIGGQGGQGGKGKYGRAPKDGGDGGQGGDGGNGGNGGDIWAFLLYESGISEEKLAELRIQLESNIIALPGQGGVAGNGGVGGVGGAPGSSHWSSSMRGQGGAGMPGNLGAAGEAGQNGAVIKDLKAAEAVRPPIGVYAAFGTVYDHEQNPLERVSVQLEGREGFAITDATGSWRFEDLPSGEYTAVASKTGYEFEPQTFMINQQDAEVSIQLQAMPEVSYLDKCIAKFSDYFGEKIDEAFDCGNDNAFVCQETTGSVLGEVVGIAIPKSQQGDFYYYWGTWGPLSLSFCD